MNPLNLPALLPAKINVRINILRDKLTPALPEVSDENVLKKQRVLRRRGEHLLVDDIEPELESLDVFLEVVGPAVLG